MKYIGLDIGTTTVKGQLLDGNGEILSSSEFLLVKNSRDGIFYVDAQKLKESIFSIIKELALCCNGKVDAICFSSFGEAFTLIDKEGKPISDFILFFSDLGEKEKKVVENKLGQEKIARISGLLPHRMYSFSKLMWIKDNQPDIYEKADKVLLVSSYAVYLLTGIPICDYSLATRTMCFDVNKSTWSKEIINACGLKESLFPELKKCDEIVGSVTKDVAKELGIISDCKVLASAHDQLLASAGCGLCEAGMANDGTGTAQCTSVVFDKIPEKFDFYKNNFCVVPYIFPNTYLAYAFIATGGALLNWHQNYLSPLEREKCKEEGINYYAKLSNSDVSIPTSLLVLPHFAGSGTPYLNAESTGAILGLNQNTTKEEIYFSLMEGSTYEMKLNYDLLKKNGIKINKLSANGGGSKNPAWLRIKTNVYNKNIRTMNSPEGGIFGAFILMKHTIEHEDYKVLMKRLIKTKKIVKPEKTLVEAYKYNYRKYKKIYPAMMKIWR